MIVDIESYADQEDIEFRMLQAPLAARLGGKTHTSLMWWVDELCKMFPRKQTKLLKSKSKQSRIVSVVIKLGE